MKRVFICCQWPAPRNPYPCACSLKAGMHIQKLPYLPGGGHLITNALCNTNLEQGNIPFLHVLESNQRAISLYEYMGFTKRRNKNSF